MAVSTKKRTDPCEGVEATKYRGKQIKTGNSTGFRFEGALFRSHPEFNGNVTAHVLAPGRLLVTAVIEETKADDPVMAAFLAFLAEDIATSPQMVEPLDDKLAKRIDRLVEGVEVSPDSALGNEAILL